MQPSLFLLRKKVNLLALHPCLLLYETAALSLLPKCYQVISLEVGNMVRAHDFVHGIGSFLGVVKGDLGSVVMEHVSFNGTMHDETANEAEVAING